MELTALWDLLPTFVDFAGGAPPTKCQRGATMMDVCTDGLSLKPVMTGQVENQENHRFLFWEYCDRQAKTWIENNKKTNCIIAMRTTTHKLLQKHGNFGPNVQAPKEYVVYEMPLDGSGDLQEQNGVTVDDPFTDTMWKDLLDEAYTPLYKDGNYTYGYGNGVYPTTSGL